MTLVGATTENPYHDVIGALLSRCRLHEFRPLDAGALERVLERAASVARGRRCRTTRLGPRSLTAAGGDARSLLVALEVARDHALSRQASSLEATDVAEAVERRPVCTTRRATATTTRSRRSSRACAAPIPTRRSTTSPR